MSMRPIPNVRADAKTEASGQSAAFGVHDTLRHGIQTVRGNLIGGHPLEPHLAMVYIIFAC